MHRATSTLAFLLVAAGFVLAQEPPSQKPPSANEPKRSEACYGLHLRDKPLEPCIRLCVDVDQMPIEEYWDRVFQDWFVYFDRDRDGRLSREEGARLPSAFSLRQVLWGQFPVFPLGAARFGEVDADGNGTVDQKELSTYFRSGGVGGIVVGAGQVTETAKLNAALLARLDRNQNGKIEEAEIQAATAALAPLDVNEDELIEPGELVKNIPYPGALGATLMETRPRELRFAESLQSFPLFVVRADLPPRETRRTPEPQTRSSVANHSAEQPNSSLQGSQVPPWRAQWDQKASGNSVRLTAFAKEAEGMRLDRRGEAYHLTLRLDEGKLPEMILSVTKRWRAIFNECDTDSSGTLTASERDGLKGGPFKELLGTVDANGDGEIAVAEFQAWLDLQGKVARGLVFLSVIDHGRGFFEFLDRDNDGVLTTRELKTASERLKTARCLLEKGNQGKEVDLNLLPHRILASLSLGHPKTPLGKLPARGPQWFQAMDRNGDQDVSRKEFTGSSERFAAFDSDGDGLIDCKEAEKLSDQKPPR